MDENSKNRFVWVTDPAKCSDKYGQTYISYRVTSGNNKNYSSNSVSVVRRYSDFVWLYGQLTQQFLGVIMPPLPEKQSVGRFGSEFVETRRRALEKFLFRVLYHPELGSSDYFKQFLTSDDNSLHKLKEESNKQNSKSSSPSPKKWLAIGSGGKSDVEKTPSDVKVNEIVQYVNGLEKQMNAVRRQADHLIKRNRDLSNSLFEFGQSFTLLGQTEGGDIGQGLIQLGSVSEAVSVSTSSFAGEQIVRLLEPFEEYSRMLSTIRSAVSQRNEKKFEFLRASADLETKQNGYKKILGVSGKEQQAIVKGQSVSVAQDVLDSVKFDYDKANNRLLEEFESFGKQKLSDMKEIIISFLSLQIDYHKKCEQAWSDLLPKVSNTLTADPMSLYTNNNTSSDVASNYISFSSPLPPPPPSHKAPPSLPSSQMNHLTINDNPYADNDDDDDDLYRVYK